MEKVIGILIGSNVIAFIILLIRSTMGKYLSKRFAYGMWILLPLFMLVFPIIEVPMPKVMQAGSITLRDWAEAVAEENEILSEPVKEKFPEQMELSKNALDGKDEMISDQVISVIENEILTTTKEAVQGGKMTFMNIIVKGYVLIACVVLVVIVFINANFILKCRQKRVWREKSFGLGLAVYELQDISSPFLFGRSIYVPTEMTEEEMRYGILHEEYHYRHGDSIWVIVRHLMLAIHFYSPIMWAAFKASGYDCELACDEAVMERIHEKEKISYGKCLLHIMENSKYRGAGLLSTNMKSGKSLIKERIKVIASQTKNNLSVMLVVTAFLMVVVSWLLLEKTTMVAAQIEEVNKVQASMVQEEAEGQMDLSDSTEDSMVLEENNESKEVQPVILYPLRMGQYYATQSSEPWIVEDENGLLFGYTDDVHVEGGPLPISLGYRFFLDGEASSVLESQGEHYYDGFYAAIPDRETTWSEGVVGDGIGEYVEIQQLLEAYEENTIDGKLYFDEMCIVTGYAKNETVWKNNNRAKTLNFYFEDEYVGIIELKDTMLPQYIDISELDLHVLNGEMANFRFEIIDVYDGEWCEDTCITGVDFKYRTPNEQITKEEYEACGLKFAG